MRPQLPEGKIAAKYVETRRGECFRQCYQERGSAISTRAVGEHQGIIRGRGGSMKKSPHRRLAESGVYERRYFRLRHASIIADHIGIRSCIA